MKIRAAICSVLLFIPFVSLAEASEFRLNPEGLGPIVVSMEVRVREANEELTAFPRKIAELDVVARNESGQPIRYAKFCVQAARRTKGCDFQLWTKRIWQPGEELLWMLDGRAPRGIDAPRIVLVKVKR